MQNTHSISTGKHSGTSYSPSLPTGWDGRKLVKSKIQSLPTWGREGASHAGSLSSLLGWGAVLPAAPQADAGRLSCIPTSPKEQQLFHFVPGCRAHLPLTKADSPLCRPLPPEAVDLSWRSAGGPDYERAGTVPRYDSHGLYERAFACCFVHKHEFSLSTS